MKLVPFENQSALPAYLTSSPSLLDINKEVVRATGFPVMSIKGKVFTMVQDGSRTVLTKPDDPEEVAQSIGVVFLRANMHTKVYYNKKYSEGESDGARPDCYSYDGQAPSPNAQTPQSKKCAVCPHNQWGARVGADGEAKGKACQDNARIAISTPDNMNPTLLRVPPASLKALKEMLRTVASRKVPYNAVVVKIGFDREAPSPKLTFKPVGLMDDTGYAQVSGLYDDELVRAIVGVDDLVYAPRTDPADELDAALAERANAKGLPTPTASAADDEEAPPPPAPAKPVKAAKTAPAPAPAAPAPVAAKAEAASASLLADLDALLGNKDD